MKKGLSHFVAASFVEDKFGVVQKDLPDVLTMLLDLQTVKLGFIFFFLGLYFLKIFFVL